MKIGCSLFVVSLVGGLVNFTRCGSPTVAGLMGVPTARVIFVSPTEVKCDDTIVNAVGDLTPPCHWNCAIYQGQIGEFSLAFPLTTAGEFSQSIDVTQHECLTTENNP